MLVSVGDLATDVVVRLGSDEIDPVSDTPAVVSLHRGGAAANVAAVSARLGRPARYVGALGADELATQAAAALAALGVEVAGPSARRGWSIVVLVDPDGRRRFLTDTGDVDPWPEPDPAWLVGVSRLHLSGYALCDERSSAGCRVLAELAGERGVPVSVDPCSTSMVEGFGTARFAELLMALRPDVVLPNEDEARLLPDDLVALRVVTHGAGPTEVLHPDGRRSAVPVAPVDVVDTTGAGDAFVAGFLAAYDDGADAEAAVVHGHAAAARVVAGPGADAWEDPGP